MTFFLFFKWLLQYFWYNREMHVFVSAVLPIKPKRLNDNKFIQWSYSLDIIALSIIPRVFNIQTWCNRFRWVSMTPFGFPVVPLVYTSVATSSELIVSYVYFPPEIKPHGCSTHLPKERNIILLKKCIETEIISSAISMLNKYYQRAYVFPKYDDAGQ